MKVYDPYNHGKWINNYEESDFNNSDIVVLPGGSDILPKYYNHSAIPGCYYNEKRDIEEYSLLQKAIDVGKFLIGTCKGAQWLTIAAGGWLIQDISNHHNHHTVITSDGKSFMINSSHHQMCYPYDLPKSDYKILAWAQQQSSYHIIQEQKQLIFPTIALDNDDLFKEPEAIWYPKIKGLALQNHFEWSSNSSESYEWVNEKLIELYNENHELSKAKGI